MSTIMILLRDEDAHRRTISVLTTAKPPQAGQGLSPAEALAMELLNIAQRRTGEVAYQAAPPEVVTTAAGVPLAIGTPVQGSAT